MKLSALLFRICVAAVVITAAVAAAGCSRLSKDAKKMVGEYYINEVSTEEPVMVLKSNGTVIQRAIKPGILAYSVKGCWNVKNDSLVIVNEPTPFDVEGDSTLIGQIPERMAKAVVAFTGTALTLRSDGADYLYFRRGHRED